MSLGSVSPRAHPRWEAFLDLCTDELDIGVLIETR